MSNLKQKKKKNNFFETKKINYKDSIKKIKENKIKTLFLENIIDLETINLKKSESLHILTIGKTQIVDILEKIINYGIDDLYISTLSYDYKSLEKILKLYDEKKIKKIRLIRCSLFVSDRQDLYNYTYEEFVKRNQKVIGLNAHSKLCLLTNNQDKYYVISGSQNLTKANLIEQLTIYNNKELFEFYKKWFDFTFNEEVA